MKTMKTQNRLPLTLLFLRLSVFLVMLMWTIDKFIQPQHASKIMEHFYFTTGVGYAAIYILAGLELVLLVAFVAGIAKRWTYGLVLLLHGLSTVVAYQEYLHPFQSKNLLFFAAWPMLVACFTLYYLREDDVLWTVKPSNKTGPID